MDDRQHHDRDVISIREHLEGRIRDTEKNLSFRIDAVVSHMESKFAWLDTAVRVAKEDQSHRFDTTNEWRAVVNDLIDNKANVADMEKVEADIRLLRESKATLEGKASQQSVSNALLTAIVGLILAAAGLVIGIIGLFYRFGP